MKETMTVHKALSELKVLDSRISNAIENLDVVVANKHSNGKISGVSVAQYIEDAKASYKSVVSLINRRDEIKRKVTRSNAITMVTINGKEYSVAEAIDMKAKGIAYKQQLAFRLREQLAEVKQHAELNNNRLESRADEYIKSLYGGSDLKNMSEEIEKARNTFINSQTYELVDPIGAGAVAETLKANADAFMSEVDAALSVSNALTTIEIEYETI